VVGSQVGLELFVASTAFVNMQSFNGVQCVGGDLLIGGNPFFSSLDGMSGLDSVNYGKQRPAPTLQVVGNAIFGNAGPSSVSALAKVRFTPLPLSIIIKQS
jgi:hypothetical protein